MMNKSWIGLVVMFCVTNFCFTEAQEKCSSYAQAMCDDGECIDSDLFCDGIKHCRDGSDETGQRCLAVECPKFSWKCTYGACASRDAKCNHVQDCVDNSDENARLCNYTAPNRITKDGMFKCDSGELISADYICDGPKHCEDGSDETTEQCSVIDCPEWGFQCAYGGCISKHLKCNGNINCADGSDEYPLVCNKPYERISPNQRLNPTIIPENGCKVSENPNLLTILVASNETLSPGSYVQMLDNVDYACRPKHLLEGVQTNYCDNGKWIYEEPVCIRYCYSNHLKGVTFSANCEYNRSSVPCEGSLKFGTIAKISCQVGYKKPGDRVVQDVLRCDEYGEWDYSPYRCEPICGLEKNDGIPFLLRAETVNVTLVPWHAAIYIARTNGYENICGGTIINAKVVISAAHCFWLDNVQQIVNHTLIMVGVGKVYRNYLAEGEPFRAQYFNVSEIHVLKGYKDSLMAYRDDIAILVLVNSIKFMPEVKPICLEWHDYHQRYVRSGIVGRLAGWGKTGEELISSNELRMVELPTVSYEECENSIEPKFRSALASDKFCVYSVDGVSACQGDSGGGFVVPKLINGVNTYFLVGVVSNGLVDAGKCTPDFYTTFTNIQFHQTMIMAYEANFRPK